MLEELFISNCNRRTERADRKIKGTVVVSTVVVKSANLFNCRSGIELSK